MGHHDRIYPRAPRTRLALGALGGDRESMNENDYNAAIRVTRSYQYTLRATTDFGEAANRADVVVTGVPSHGSVTCVPS